MQRLFCILLLVVVSLPSPAADRVALVIGNNNYLHAGKLVTPVPDATSMADTLKNKLGFKVILRTEAKFNDMVDAVDQFKVEAVEASAVFIYFAGHGIESDSQGGNFLIPVDALLEKESHLKSQSYSLNTLLGELNSLSASVRLVVLDCCRSNPLEGRSWSSGRGNAGLARVDLQRLDAATMVVFSAGPGKVARDRVLASDIHSPFATALLANIQQPGTSAFGVFSNVESAVFKATGQKQKPKTFFSGELSPFHSFVFLPGAPAASLPPLAAGGPTGATRDRPWVNRLGMEFIPVPGQLGVFLCRTETRVRDFRVYATDTGYRQKGGITAQKVKETGIINELDIGASWEKPGFPQSEDHPVVGVSWNEAKAFLTWLSKKENLIYRLPTDAEWSAAVGLGKYPWGNAWPPPVGAGNYRNVVWTETVPNKPEDAHIHEDGASKTAPVASFPENKNGFHDLGGNVSEWCEDFFRPDMNSAAVRKANPVFEKDKLADGSRGLVNRGGSWAEGCSMNLLSGYRARFRPEIRSDNFGFRVVVVVGSGG